MVFVYILVNIKTYTIMTKKNLNELILAFAIVGGFCFIVGIANPWLLIGSLLFGGAAAVAKLFEPTLE